MQQQGDFATITPPGGLPKITTIYDFSAEALGQLRLWFEQNPPAIGITNILGFAQFTANGATVATSEGTTSAAYTDLATVGPQITGLSNGKYLLLWCATVFGTANGASYLCGPSVNSAAPTVDARAQSILAASVANFTLVTLSAGNNTVKLRYASDGVQTGTWFNRTLVALRYANP